MLENTNLSLVHIGGGEKEDLDLLNKHAKSCKVDVWFCSKIDTK